jgi:hypothetical protein
MTPDRRRRVGIVLALCLGVAPGATFAQNWPMSVGKGGQAKTFGQPLTLESGPDDGFLACAAPVLRPNFVNKDTDEAFRNLGLKANASSVGVVTGHGHAGLLCTGGGNQCNTAGTMMGLFNRPAWEQAAAKLLNQFSAVLLLGCSVGAGQEGADFLFEVAKVINMPVAAPTHWVWCEPGKISLDKDAHWQQATPQNKPKVIPRPAAKPDPPGKKAYGLSIEGKPVQVAASAVKVTDFKAMLFTGGLMVLRPAPAGTASQMLQFIDFENPLINPGVPAAMVTATIDLDVRINDRLTRKTFKVYNDELVQDSAQRGVYYNTTASFARLLLQLRTRSGGGQ